MSIEDILKDCETLVDNCGSPYPKEHTKECALIVIKAQIDILNKTIDMFGQVNYTTITALRYELKQQLKKLES